MMLLLDTHTALWFWWDDPKLSTTAKGAICDPANRKLVSPASAWEVAIKLSLKKLRKKSKGPGVDSPVPQSRQQRQRHDEREPVLEVPHQLVVGGDQFAAFALGEGNVQQP